MTSEEIAKLILTHVTKIEELNYLGRVLKHQYNHLQQFSADKFSPGQPVWFNSKLRGRVDGKIIKINAKTISVKADTGMTWKVSPSLLKVA